MATSATRTTQKKSLRKTTATKAAPAKVTRTPKAPTLAHKKMRDASTADMAQAFVPNKSVLNGYESRRAMGDKSEFDVFDFAFDHAMNVIIEGPTGTGKTTAVQAWAAKRGLRFGSLSSHAGADHTQMFGRVNQNEDAKAGEPLFYWKDGLVTDVFRNGGVLLVNEMNFLPERVASVLFGPTDSRRALTLMDRDGEVIMAHRPTTYKRVGDKIIDITCWCDDPSGADCKSKWVLMVGDFNPDYEGTRNLNKAFRNRWAIQMVFNYDPEVEKMLVKSDSLRQVATDIRNDDSYETPVATNMLIEFETIALGLGIDFAAQNFVNHFLDDERGPIKLVLDAYKLNIDAELNADEDEPEEDDDADDDSDVIEVDADTFDWIHSTK